MTRKVALRKPIEVFGKSYNELELKEPSGGLYLKLGDPRILVFNASGSGYWIEQSETINAYLDKLVYARRPPLRPFSACSRWKTPWR